MSHEHYFRDVSGLDQIDVYRILDLFGVTCPIAQHVVKKALVAGQRGHKSNRRDWQDIADSAARKLQMLDEDMEAMKRAGLLGGCAANALADTLATNCAEKPLKAAQNAVSAVASCWPNGHRRQDSEAEDEAWKAAEARMDVIGQNGATAEHYAQKPDWIVAPDRANWLAQDKSGEWWWFESEPQECVSEPIWHDLTPSSGVWSAGTKNATENECWRETLERRP